MVDPMGSHTVEPDGASTGTGRAALPDRGWADALPVPVRPADVRSKKDVPVRLAYDGDGADGFAVAERKKSPSWTGGVEGRGGV